MTDIDNQRIAANYMGAVAHLLTGKPGRLAEFIRKVEVLLSGTEPKALQLMQWTSRVQQTGCPVIWIHHSADRPHQPQIGLVACADQMYIIENCMLWQSSRNTRAVLVPDCYSLGAFSFDDDIRLKRSDRAPARTFDQAEKQMARAYHRLREIEIEQSARGEAFPLPLLARAA